jgi:phage shock protein C
MKKLYRSRKNRKLAGVCGGIGEYFDLDPTLVRLIWIMLILAAGTGVLAYIIGIFIMPVNPDFPENN